MGETIVAAKGTPPATGQSSGGKEGSTSAEVEKAVSDALAKQGREHKAVLAPIIAERDSLKVQVGKISVIQSEKDDLQKQLDELASGDPATLDLTKRMKEAKDKLREAKDKLDAAIVKESVNAEAEKKIRKYRLQAIASEYEGGDAVKLQELADIAGVTSETKEREIADTLWKKKGEGDTPVPDSNLSAGGGGSDYKSIRDAYIKNPNDPKARQAYLKVRRERGL